MRKTVLLVCLLLWASFLTACTVKNKQTVSVESPDPATSSVGLVVTEGVEESSDTAAVWLTVTDAPQDNDNNDTVLDVVEPSNN